MHPQSGALGCSRCPQSAKKHTELQKKVTSTLYLTDYLKTREHTVYIHIMQVMMSCVIRIYTVFHSHVTSGIAFDPLRAIAKRQQFLNANFIGLVALIVLKTHSAQPVTTITRPRGCKFFFKLNSAKHEILNAHIYRNIK